MSILTLLISHSFVQKSKLHPVLILPDTQHYGSRILQVYNYLHVTRGFSQETHKLYYIICNFTL